MQNDLFGLVALILIAALCAALGYLIGLYHGREDERARRTCMMIAGRVTIECGRADVEHLCDKLGLIAQPKGIEKFYTEDREP